MQYARIMTILYVGFFFKPVLALYIIKNIEIKLSNTFPSFPRSQKSEKSTFILSINLKTFTMIVLMNRHKQHYMPPSFQNKILQFSTKFCFFVFKKYRFKYL